MTRTIKKDDEAGVRIAEVGPGVYEVQFREYTKSGKPKWISNALTRTVKVFSPGRAIRRHHAI